MKKITQYRPAYFTGFENEEVEYNLLEELLEVDFVKNFAKNDDFFKFSVSSKHYSFFKKNYLMAEFKEGKTWYVVGETDDNEIITNLPEWIPNKDEDK